GEDGMVAGGHALHGEACLGGPPAGGPVEVGGVDESPGEGGVVAAKVAGASVVDDLRGGAHRGADDGCSPGQGFDHDHTEGLRPGDRVEEADGVGQKAILVVSGDLADVFDVAAEQGTDDLLVVGALGGFAHLGGDEQGHARLASQADGPVDALVRVHPAQEGGVPPPAGTGPHTAHVDAVVDDRVDRDVEGAGGLVVGDGDDG